MKDSPHHDHRPSRASAKFERIVQEMRRAYRVRVRRWRTTMTGCAWSVVHEDGKRVNWIEAPYPKTPISLAIFLHEIGHHAIGFERYRKRCEEEYHVWVWALQTMRELGTSPDARVLRRFELSVRYAVEKAARRGMRVFPLPLQPYTTHLPHAA
jgi:hypothetical protein